jgi:hypothetical protein
MARKDGRSRRGALAAEICAHVVLPVAAGCLACTTLVSNQDQLAGNGRDASVDGDASGSDAADALGADARQDAGGDEREDAPGADACAPSCSEGDFQCGANGVQICAMQKGCLVWRDLAACTADHLCCAGACESVDETNCYACGKRCEGDTPICDRQKKACGCRETSCPSGKVCDPVRGACVATYDFYVNATAPTGGDGTFEHPFRTITEALAAASKAGSTARDGGAAGAPNDASVEGEGGIASDEAGARGEMNALAARIHVDPGVYNQALGETFPLVIPGGVVLEGEGPEKTTIEGLAYLDPGMTGYPHWVTMVVGDPVRTSHVSGFTLRPKGPPARTFTAIDCPTGNASKPDAESPAPPNTFLSNLVIGPHYGRGVDVSTGATSDSGCNLRLTKSTILDNEVGVVGFGCAQSPKYTPVRVELESNTFKNLVNTDGYGNAIRFGGCSRMVAKNNTIIESDVGMTLYGEYAPEIGFSIHTLQGNVFDSLSREGLSIQGGAVLLDDFSDNTFTNVTSEHTLPDSLYSVAMHLSGSAEPTFPTIRRARNNRFIGNDIGLKIESYMYPAGFPGSDFGNENEPGNNVFRCNGGRAGIDGQVGDVVFAMYDLDSPVSFPFVGNEWDHVPVQVQDFTSNPLRAVADVLVRKNVVVGLANARTAPLSCPRDIQP